MTAPHLRGRWRQSVLGRRQDVQKAVTHGAGPGQPNKSNPSEPIRNAADFVSWRTPTLDALHLDRLALVGMFFGGWLALNYAVTVPQRVQKLVLLSPGGLLPMVRQFSMRGVLIVSLPTRLTVNSFFRWLGFTDRAYAKMLDWCISA